MRNLIWSGLAMVILLSGCGWGGTASRPNTFTPLTSITITAAYSTIAQGTSVKLTATGNFSGLFTRDISDQVSWSSNATTVANFVTAASPSRVTGLAPTSAVLTATMGGVSANFKLTVTSATITAVAVTPATASVPLGLTQQFTATGTFSDGSKQDITFDATWASSNTAAATVSNAASDNTGGEATTVAAGTTTISATFGGVSSSASNSSASLTVTVPVLQSITISTPVTSPTEPNPSVLSLSTVTFTATGNYSDGSNKNLNSQVTWASGTPSVAPTPDSAGTTQALATGTTNITASLNGITSTTTLTVAGGNLVSFTLPTSLTVVSGTSTPVSVIGTFSNGATRDITGVLNWSVTDTSLATLTGPTGNRLLVSAGTQKTGSTTLTAASPSLSASTTLSVTNPALSSFSVSPLTSLTAGTSGHLTATAHLSNGTTQDVTADATWTSNAPSVAKVGPVGPAGVQITGVATGSATISVTFGSQILTTPAIAVSTRNLKSFAITPSTNGTANVTSGQQTKFTATATYSDGVTADITSDVTWTTGDANIAILADQQNQPGQVVGVGVGSTILAATFGGQTAQVTLNVQ